MGSAMAYRQQCLEGETVASRAQSLHAEYPSNRRLTNPELQNVEGISSPS